jgi:hypothetical protein
MSVLAESFSFRTNDVRNGTEREAFWRKRTKLSRIHEPITATWLEGFVQNVGQQRAWRLLPACWITKRLQWFDITL